MSTNTPDNRELPPMDDAQDRALVSAITQTLTEQTESLDGHTRSRLTQARAAAMAARARQQRGPLLGWVRSLLPTTALGSGVAASAMLALLVAAPLLLFGPGVLRAPSETFQPAGPAIADTGGPVDELEIVLAGDIEMLEDLEFFEWLATQPVG
ncbi:MAG: DUF3619 family protein [Pseudomonadota bacterium]